VCLKQIVRGSIFFLTDNLVASYRIRVINPIDYESITILNVDKNVNDTKLFNSSAISKRPNTLECKSYARAGRTTAQYFTSLYVVVDS